MTEETVPTIEISEAGFDLPVVEVLTGRGVIHGKSGSGKSNSLGVIIEELLDQGFPLCIVDADGEHYGLKQEYELLHVGADDSADVIVGPEHAETLAEVMLGDDVPVILDISGFVHREEANELVERVVSKLLSMEKKRKKPFPVFIEEVHTMVPQAKQMDSVGEAIVTVATRGRKHGLGVVGASQRPAKVDKDFVTQADWSVWHRLTWSQDTKVVKDVVGPEYAEAVQELDTGEAIVATDWDDEVRTIQFRRKRTFDAGATPGLEDFEPPDLKGVSDAVIERLKEITEEREAEEAERDRLEEQVEELEAEKESLESELDDLRSGDVVESEEIDRLKERVESLKDQRENLQAKLEATESEKESLRGEVDELSEQVSEFRSALVTQEKARDAVREALSLLGGEPESEDSAEVERLKQRIDRMEQSLAEVESERDALRQKLERAQARSGELVPDDASYVDFIKKDAVQEAIQEAKDAARRPGYVADILAAIIAEGGRVSYADIAERKDVSTTGNISSAASRLEDVKVISKEKVGNETYVDLNIDGIEDILRAKEKREQTAEIREKYL